MKLSVRVLWPLCAVLTFAGCACEDTNARVIHSDSFIPEEPAAIAPSCEDLVLNGEETDVDCGGPVCGPCSLGKRCTADLGCTSGRCLAGTCALAISCTNGVKDGTESDIDCGGPDCAACTPGQGCGTGADCSSQVCTAGVCQAATCFDAVANGQETGVDCGGPACAPCGVGGGCLGNGDCSDGVCVDGLCVAATCNDGVRNGAETDVDCGGGTCAACAPGDSCGGDADCASLVCLAGTCAAPTCTDGRRNGQESGLDCGGPTCAPCVAGQGCVTGADCASLVCAGGVCLSPSCTDGVFNGLETDLDCGGPACGNCGTGQGCVLGADCLSSVCTDGVCVAGSCSDGVTNGAETGVDCGGGSCPSCGNGASCEVSTDCTSGVCAGGVCVAPACTDGVLNGQETGLDCGGPDCANCGTGLGCSSGNDCVSGVCTANLCAAPSCSDGVRNGAESDVDCGGTCPSCGAGSSCNQASDCASGNCASGTCGPVILSALVVSPGPVTVPLGRTQAFTATARYSDGSSADVSAAAIWSSSDTTSATISSAGVLQTLSLGGTTVQAIYQGLSGTAAVTVGAPALDRLDVTPVGVQLPIGLVQAYRATGTFSDGSLADLTGSVAWSSSAPAVASVSSSGLATGLAAGTTAITASLAGVTGSTPLEVTSVFVTSLSVTPATLTLPTGVRAAFRATALLSDGSARDVTNESTWASSAAGVASVGINPGLVTALSAGAANITATLAGTSGFAVLTVINATLNTIQVFPADETVPRGFELQYGAVGLYSDGNAYDLTLTAAWSSTAPNVATVSNTWPQQGVVQTLDLGTTQLRASVGSLTGSTSLTVNGATLTSLSLTPAIATLPIGAPLQYRATGAFSDGTARDVTALATWRSSSTAVAIISNATGSRGLLTTLSSGNTTVSAALGGQVATSQLRVTTATFETLSLSPPTARIGQHAVVPFVATAIYTDGTALDVSELSAWRSSDALVASVRNDTGYRGLTEGLTTGATRISATFTGHTAEVALTVTNANLVDIYISPAVVRTGVGMHVQFEVAGIWSDGTTADVTRVATWTSSLDSVAVVSNLASSEGLATTRGVGVATIVATWAGRDDHTTLTVTNASLRSITVRPGTTVTGVGAQVQYRALGTFTDGTTFDVTTIASWTSSNAAVAAVSGASGTIGLATALAGGTATLSARVGAVNGTATLTVTSAALVSVLVTPATGIIPIAYWRQYTATARYADGVTADVTRQAAWTTGTPAVAAAGNGALFGGRVNGLSPGSSSVRARFEGLGGTAGATVLAMGLSGLVITPDGASTPVGVPLQLSAIGTFTDGTTTVNLDITLQVGWKVSPKKDGTVSNTDGSRGVVTMYEPNGAALVHVMAYDPGTTSTNTANARVFSPAN